MRRTAMLGLPLAMVLVGCAGESSTPDRAPDAVGAVAAVETSDGVTSVLFDHDPGYEYFEDTTFVLDNEVTILGAVTHASAIDSGDHIVVWTGACAESFPVQCDVEALKVERQ